MNWMIYYLYACFSIRVYGPWLTFDSCKNVAIKARIVDKLSATFSENHNADQPLPFTKLNKIPLLEHMEMECLRLHPPIGYAMPRDTPPQGAEICGVYIPGGTAVGVPAASIGRNGDVYTHPNAWEPDRWLGEKGDLATMKTAFLGFGHGSRQCIGRNVATQFITKMIATLLLRYDVALEDPNLELGTKEPTIQKPDQRYNVILKPRSSS